MFFRRRRKPLSVIDLRPGGTVRVVGESQYQSSLNSICGGKTETGHRLRAQALLIREPANRYDPNAVSVQIEGETVGYLAREDAASYLQLVDGLAANGQVGRCEATVVGGWDNSDNQGHYGVLLHLAEPEVAHPQSSPGPVRARSHTGASANVRHPSGMVDGKHYTDWVDTVKQMKREKRYDEALALLYRLASAAEAECAAVDQTLPPWYFEQIAIEERRAKQIDREIAVLRRYEASPLAIAGQFTDRLIKATAKLDSP